MIKEILEYNKKFVESKGYEKYITGKYPKKKIAILTCMDTRLTELLPAALGIHNGDAKIIKNAGGVVTDKFGEAIRSLLVAVYELGVTDVMVIAHTDCGACHMNAAEMEQQMMARGIARDTIDLVDYCGRDLNAWLQGFGDTGRSVKDTVHAIANHPLIPRDVRVSGFIMDSVTGALTLVE
ncbi:MAG: carbonic anhydrase [Prevotellaceae bacterium]|nr:carbonic anhydrase [Prevotellaceae bacterium]